MMIAFVPTNMHMPPQYPGGNPEPVMQCSLGCLVPRQYQNIHQASAHSGS